MLYVAIYTTVLLLLIIAGTVRRPSTKERFLLAASYIFYGTFGFFFLSILIGSSLTNFLIGGWLKRRQTLPRLWTGILFNVGLLSLFKYLPSTGSFQNILMPIGMSFWTFQALSYLFDLYRQEGIDASLTEFCLYLAFWPTVTMGPICRLSTLLPEFREIRSVPFSDLSDGVRRIGVGLFMKVVLAQLLASGVNAGFNRMQAGWGGLDVWILAIGFGFQLFFDFAGYSHIVIGSARLFGFHLDENFDSPYLATTPSIFWTKWHMSLSSWIRDYVFIPIATMRRAIWWRYFAVWLAMLLFGLWHGSRMTFLVWGAYHGALLVAHRLGQQLERKLGVNMDGGIGVSVSWLATFLAVSLGWIAFRATDLHQMLQMFQAVVSLNNYRNLVLPRTFYLTAVVLVVGYFAFASIATSLVVRARAALWLQRVTSSSVIGQPAQFFQENAWLFVVPMVAVIAVFCVLVFSDQTANVSPFVYAVF
jgi:alginate O-acetyltransferase complex protein AlgI